LLLEDVFRHCKADEGALTAFKARIIKARENAKLNKQSIAQAMVSYAVYGAKNPFNSGLTAEELDALKAQDLVDLLHNLFNYTHQVIYYGPRNMNQLSKDLQGLHAFPASFTEATRILNFKRIPTENKVLFADYNAVQSEVYWVKTLETYDPKEEAITLLFNQYFGGGMGSIVFQTIRESKALAYSTFAVVQAPQKKEDPFSFIGYVGSQADKMNEAISGMNALLQDLPRAAQNLEAGRESLLKSIETERVIQDGLIMAYLAAKKKGWTSDYRKEIYTALKSITIDDLVAYHQKLLAKGPYTYLVIGSKDRIAEADLEKRGEVKKLTLEELFGY
jgi:predicted Zn-dependent peptidase